MTEILFSAMSSCLPADFDLAGAIHEDLLNDFGDAHHRVYYSSTSGSIYRGSDVAPDLGISKWSYDIKKPARFDLTPLEKAAWNNKVSQWFEQLPETYAFSKKDRGLMLAQLAEQPNSTIFLDEVVLRVEFDPTISNPPPPAIEVPFALRASGIIGINSKNAFTFTPLSIEVDDPAKLEEQIEDALKKIGVQAGQSTSKSGSSFCYPIDVLVKHLIRAFLRTRINQYLIDLPLPSSVDLFEGFSISELGIKVCNDYLIAYGKGQPVAKSIKRANATRALSAKRFSSEQLGAIADEGEGQDEFYSATRTKGGYILLWVSKALLQAAADKNLSVDSSDSDDDSSGAINWAWSWWMRLRNSGVTLINNNKIRIGLDFRAGGKASASIDTHCGSIGLKTGLRVKLFPEPTRIDLSVGLDSAARKIKLKADTKPGGVIVEPADWWDAIGWVLSAIITTVGTVLWNTIDFALNLMSFNVADLPERFPGTDLKYKTYGFQTSFWGSNHYLITLGVDFD
jgi:hypothetical protein